MDFLKSSVVLSKLHSLHTCHVRSFRILRGAEYPTEYILPPQAGHESGMSIFIKHIFLVLNIRRT